MAAGTAGKARVTVRPVTAERWDDLVRLFGARGACAGCWCMWFRLPRAEFEAKVGSGNRRALRSLVHRGAVPGLLAYVGGQPAGWISLGPRVDFPRLDRSRLFRPVDERPVWSVVCFFVGRGFRGLGLTEEMLRHGATYARRHGAKILEGYPLDPAPGRVPDVYAYHGLADAFRAAGFKEVARRSATRPIMRLEL